MTLNLFTCRAVYRYAPGWPPDWRPLVCTREAGHEGDHEDETEANPLHAGLPHWRDE